MAVQTKIKFLFVLALLIVADCFAQSSVSPIAIDGMVRDSSGAVVRGAVVRLQSGVFHATAKSDDQGHFAFASVPLFAGAVEVAADGFRAARKSWTAADVDSAHAQLHLEISLEPAAAGEQVVVSAARAEVRLADTPGSNILLSNTDLTASPALRMDDVLREVPGFSLFRRSSSRTANASLQGVSLRGLGGTAASRALVLADGISLLDPFGAWVYWDRIPRTAISTVEVVRGGASNLYGSEAMGGVVQFLLRQPEAPAIVFETSYGNENTPDLSVWAGSRSGSWDYSVASGLSRTDGFILVPDSQRGTVDANANVENATVYARVGHQLGNKGKIFLRGNFFNEFRNNGTTVQINDTHLGEGAGGLDRQFGANDTMSVRIYGDVQTYHQTFSAVAADRNSETFTVAQHVPEQTVGGGAQWTHILGKSNTLIGGMDLNEVLGSSADTLFSGPNQYRSGGGRQRTLGWFGEDISHRSKWTVMLATRLDYWNNFNGKLIVVPVTGDPTLTNYADRSNLALSPRLSVLRTLNSHVSATASVYRAFRAPTLNELYRTFRVGSVTTQNNPALNAERLTGAEAGMNITGWGQRLSLRGTFFWSDIVDPVENVTISQGQAKKENLGRTRSRGGELDGVIKLARDVQITAGYTYIGATVVNYPVPQGGVDLTGLDVPQVPHNVFTWEARYWNPSRLFVSVQGRFVGRQFNDDQNAFPLDKFFTMNLQVGRQVTRNVELFAAAENLTNQRYQVGSNPTTLGPPILVRGGLRLNFPAAK